MSQSCPICGAEVSPNPRYPNYACEPCASRASDASGRRLQFGNVSLSGGLAARVADTGEDHPGGACFIDGIPCVAQEARFGGVVVIPS